MTGSDAVVGAMDEGVAEYYLGSKVRMYLLYRAGFVRFNRNWVREPRIFMPTRCSELVDVYQLDAYHVYVFPLEVNALHLRSPRCKRRHRPPIGLQLDVCTSPVVSKNGSLTSRTNIRHV